MDNIKNYIYEVLNLRVRLNTVISKDLNKLPFYLKEGFQVFSTTLMNQQLILVQPKEQLANPHQVDKQFKNLEKLLNKPVVLVMSELPSIIRKRLIQKGINFIVPGKQMYLPSLLIDLRETFRETKPKNNLLPSAQVILIYHILNRHKKLEELPLNELAQKLKYTPAAVSKAVENLKQKKLCELIGTKEKYVLFELPIGELWHRAKPFLIDPVLKRVYVDGYQRKKNIPLLRANTSALHVYSDMNPSQQEYHALERILYYKLEKKGVFQNLNVHNGQYCLEVWKYNPVILAASITEETNVDPLSLYLSLRHTEDERIEMALEKIISKYVW